MEGDYLPLETRGDKQTHFVAFARRMASVWVVVVAPRLLTGLVEAGVFPLGQRVWGDSAVCLPARAPDVWSDVFTGESVHTETSAGGRILFVRDLFRHLPVALLAGNTTLDDFAA